MLSHGRRWKYAFRAFFSLIFHGRIADDILAELAPPPAAPVASPTEDSSDRASQLLSILQRDGRLVDFLMEDLTPYQDVQVGAAVRDVHRGCREALDKYASLAPVMDLEEGSTVTVERDSEPARVKVVGNMAGAPPYRGVLRHRGWEVTRLALPPLPSTGRTVVAPAEVEVG